MEERIPLTEAEWHIMLALWRQAPQTVMELTHGLQPETGWTRHTVIALLRRMATKGTVRMQEQGRSTAVYPLVTREQVARQQTRTLLRRLFGGRLSLLVADMVAQEEVSQEELDALMETIQRARAQEEGHNT